MRLALACCLVACVSCTGTGASGSVPAGSRPPAPVASPAPTVPASPSTLPTGGVVEFSVPAGPACPNCPTPGLGGMIAGSDGNVWYIDNGRSKLGRITPAGAITERDVPSAGYGNESVARASDGSIWLTAPATTGDSGTDQILEVTPDGNLHRFAVPVLANGFAPGLDGIAVGSDGNVWFTESEGPAIVRLSRDGTQTSFSTPAAGLSPVAIAAGPDGNLWFLETANDKGAVAKMTPAGKVTEYPVDGWEGGGEQIIIAGPGGDLWFTLTGHIGRATTKGDVNLFPLPAGALPTGLTVGPDGNLWFTDSGSNAVGKMKPDGAVREYSLARRAAYPRGIAVGGDGHIWFTEAGGRIGRVGVTVPQPSLSSTVLEFGPATTETRTLQVGNTGDGLLQITSVQLAGAGKTSFRVTHDACSSTSVLPGASCSIGIALAPGSGGAFTGAYLRIADNASRPGEAVSLLANLKACRLPLYSYPAQAGAASEAAWLDVLGGAVATDPSGEFSPDAAGVYHSTARPVLSGPGPGASYDSAAGRWIPAAATETSTDGKRFAYFESHAPPIYLHVVDVATGIDRKLSTPFNNPFWGVLRFDANGIYVVEEGDNIGPVNGLWLVDPSSGARTQVIPSGSVSGVGDGAAWLAVVDPRDPNPQKGMAGNAPNSVVRKDLATGALLTWLYRPGVAVGVTGLISGGVIVEVGSSVATWWMVTGPGVASELLDPQTGEPIEGLAAVASDQQGVWFAAGGGIYLWTAVTGPQLVSTSAGLPAGPCQ